MKISQSILLLMVMSVCAWGLHHPKLRKRSTYGPAKREISSRYIVVWKKDAVDGNNATEFSARALEGIVSRNASITQEDTDPQVGSWKENGIGISAEMNEEALKKVRICY